MTTVTFILGLCGSGKSWLADRIVAAGKFDEGFFGDCAKYDVLVEKLSRGNDCVVVEIEYCRQEHRQEIVSQVSRAVPGVNINWLCIENDLFKANKNCRERSNKGDPEAHIAINERLSQSYTYPDDGVIFKTWTK
jgi:hypothetical protein